MDVLIDGRALVGNRTGIGVHTAEIARRLDVAPPPLIASHAEIANRAGIEHCRFRVDATRLGVLWQQTKLARIDADVLWGPHGTLPMKVRIPSVVTLHDFTSITMPGRHRLKTVLSFNLFIARSLERAQRVACVSRAMAEEAVHGFGVPRAKIEIVPNGVDLELFSPGGEEGDFILFVGTLEPRKGLDDLVDVWRSLPAPRPRLVLCGDRGWGSVRRSPLAVGRDDRSMATGNRQPATENIEVTGFVSNERLRDLYRSARAFVYPSRYEGFGIPPLEAMACGAPVIATRTGAIPDFAGDAALLVDPGDRDALRAALVRVLGDDVLRAELRARGPDRAREFSWDRSARTMTDLLAEAARCA